MTGRYRALTEEFLVEMERGDGFPKNAAIKKWLKENYGGVYSNAPSNARNGWFVPEKTLYGLLKMLIRDGDLPGFTRGRSILKSFMAKRGLTVLTLDDLDAILPHVATPPLHEVPDAHGPTRAPIDWLRRGASSIMGFASGPFIIKSLLRSVRGCRPQDVATAIDWMYVVVGRSSAEAGPQASPEHAKLVGRQIMKVDTATYKQRASEWHKANPWTVILSRSKREITGMSIILPLTDSAYEDILEGRRVSYDCSASEILPYSRNLLVEAAAENPDVSVGINPTKSLANAHVLQYCALTRHGRWPAGFPYRWLSFGETAKNRQRLADNGFHATGRAMAKTGTDLWERVVDVDGEVGLTMIESALLSSGARLCPPVPPVD